MMGYYDLDAFKELRRRLDAGELPKKEKKKKAPTKQPAKRKAPPSGDGSTIIARLSSTGADVKVKIKVGNVFIIPPPKPAEKKREKAEDSTPHKPRWDDASDNMYAKPFSSLKRRRSPSISPNGNSSQQDLGQPISSSTASSQSTEAVQQNGNQADTKDVSMLEPTASSNLSLPMPSTATAAVAGQPANGATANPGSGVPSAPKKAELKPTPAELNTFMQSWISRPENKDNLMPSLQQKQQIMEEIGVDKKRLEGWFYRTRKKLKQENPPDKTSSVDTKPTPKVTVSGEVGEVSSNPE
eukprot:scaffold37746_cov128-Skeletonema_dohrnii-CCMP3373.AAC.1